MTLLRKSRKKHTQGKKERICVSVRGKSFEEVDEATKITVLNSTFGVKLHSSVSIRMKKKTEVLKKMQESIK
jgi:hypothetical protein